MNWKEFLKKKLEVIKKWNIIYLSFLLPGLGQLVRKKYKKGEILLFITFFSIGLTCIAIFLNLPFIYRVIAIIPYIIVLFYSAIDSYIDLYIPEKPRKEKLLLILLIIVIAVITFIFKVFKLFSR
jgi:hypothetical protein